MWNKQNGDQKKDEPVAIAIDKDKGSQYALKWAVDHILGRGQTVTLIHVKQKLDTSPTLAENTAAMSDVNEEVGKMHKQYDSQAREIFLPFRCFCTRKDIKCQEIIIEDIDISKALIDYVTLHTFGIVILGASSKSGLVRRFKGLDVPSMVTKGAPDFCTVYIISKGKVLSVRSATRSITNHSMSLVLNSSHNHSPSSNDVPPLSSRGDRSSNSPYNRNEDTNLIKSPFTRGSAANGRSYGEISMPDSDISFVSSGRPSVDRISIDRMVAPTLYEPCTTTEFGQTPRLSNGSSDIDRLSFGSSYLDRRSIDFNTNSSLDFSSSNCSGFSTSSMNLEDMEAEMRRLRLELKQTMEMYNNACKEALTAKQKANELQRMKIEENLRIEEARLAEEAALAIAEKEKAKCKAALEAAEEAQRLAELEAQKRINAEMKALKEAEEKKKALDALTHCDVRYRRYTIEEIENATNYFSENLKIGEGGYGPVYKCTLDHTPVAIKVLRPDAAQGQSQFQQEVEILSCIRHPNMVLLLGACPEYGCLVYEHMSNGSLEDRLFCRGNTPALPWQLRFRIAAEIGTGLLFLHRTKPEPLVHRDLKPANILIDRNFVSKISDVGLARLVPPSIADSVTQYRMTQAAGTFCYIDPEYQQTGMLGIKSDIYSLGILFLQLITAKPPMGLTHHVQRAIDRGMLSKLLDPAVQDWPLEETIKFAKIALKCAELRRKDRPDLEKVVLPELNRLRDLAETNMPLITFNYNLGTPSLSFSHTSSSIK